MKTIFRLFSVGLLTVGVAAASASEGFAQSDACADVDGQVAVYTKFTELYNKTSLADRKTAVATGKEFLEKYGACEPLKEQIDFVKPQVQRIEKLIGPQELAEELRPYFNRFDEGIKKDNADEVYAAGKYILAKTPDSPNNINIMVPMGVIGMYQSTPANNYKYADDGVRYASVALNALKSGTAATKKNPAGADVYGALKFEYTKPDAMSELTYALAYLNYYGKKDKKTALPLYYELSQSGGRYKEDPRIYGTIGDYYIEQGAPIGQQIAAEIEKQKNPNETPEVKEAREIEIKKLVALFNGYTERALDAYSRAHKVAKDNTPAAKTYKDNLYKIMQNLYKRRFDKDAGLDTYVATTLSKPFPNPTSEVQPISDPEPTTGTTTTGTATAQPATSKPVATKPAGNGAKTASTTKPKK